MQIYGCVTNISKFLINLPPPPPFFTACIHQNGRFGGQIRLVCEKIGIAYEKLCL